MESSSAGTESGAQSRKRMPLGPIDDEEEEECFGSKPIPIGEMEGSRHRDDVSIYNQPAHPLHKLYNLGDTSETRMEPMWLSDPTPHCWPCWTACKQHRGCAMLQIFSLKLTKLPDTASVRCPIQIYGFMAIRDLLDPLRNYVFNRTRDDPFVIQDPGSDPFIYLSGPKRGVYLQCRVLMEYDMWIKVGEKEGDDLPLIDGAVTFSELLWTTRVVTNRIEGGSGAEVDISRVLFTVAVEATVEIWIDKIANEGGIDLSIIGFISKVDEEIKLFRGKVREPCALNRLVVAARSGSYLLLHLKPLVSKPSNDHLNWFGFRVTSHGSICYSRALDFASVQVKVTWSSLC